MLISLDQLLCKKSGLQGQQGCAHLGGFKCDVPDPHLLTRTLAVGRGVHAGLVSHSVFCFALISVTGYTSLTNTLIPYKENIFGVLIEAVLCVCLYHLSAP